MLAVNKQSLLICQLRPDHCCLTAARPLQDALRKCGAMPAFKPGAAAGGGGAQALLATQPLEPALAALRDDIRAQLQQLRLTADDLQESLMVSVSTVLCCVALCPPLR